MTPNAAKAIYSRAADLCAQGWVQGRGAIDQGGTEVNPEDEGAVAWSMAGAVRRALVESGEMWDQHAVGLATLQSVNDARITLSIEAIDVLQFVVDTGFDDGWTDAIGTQ